MSVQAMAWVFDETKATLGSKLVLLAIADHADEVGVSWPSQAKLAKKASLSERQVRRAIQNLIDLGELAVVSGQELHRTNLYWLPKFYGSLAHPEPIPPEFASDRPDNMSGVASSSTDISYRGGRTFRTDEVSKMSDEPSLEPSVEPSVKEQGARTFSFDVVEICETLSSALAERGVRAKTSAVSDAWLQEADRLFRIDHVVPDEAKMVIEWALADKWWGARLTNMKYFRDKYDTLKLQSGVSHISNNEFDELVEELRRRNSAARG